MTNREYKLEDDMIVNLMEALLDGAEFSAAVKLARIPELLVPEAHDYWNFLTRMEASSSARTVTPPHDMFERIMMQVEPVSPVVYAASASPRNIPSLIASPYMKQLFAVAGAFAALVIVISSVDINKEQPVLDRGASVAVNSDALPEVSLMAMAPSPSSKHEAYEFGVSPTAAPKPIVAAASSVTAPRMMGFAKMAAPVDEKDPGHLFAVLSETGTHEATPDTYIDDAYDTQLAAYDAAMTGTQPETATSSAETNNTTYAK